MCVRWRGTAHEPRHQDVQLSLHYEMAGMIKEVLLGILGDEAWLRARMTGRTNNEIIDIEI